VTRALKYAHSRGVAHRDLKPENICFSTLGASHVKVIDWGLSSDFYKSQMKSSVGSATYSAPEVVSAQGEIAYTSACDLWSLGVLTYVMLCGRPPFWGKLGKQLKTMLAEEYPMHSKEWSEVSEGAKDFVRRLLKADPCKRMTTEEALSHAFLMNHPEETLEEPQMQQVFTNMIGSLVPGLAPRETKSVSADLIRQVFNKLDTKSNGHLELSDFQIGFAAMYGNDSLEVTQSQAVFNKLDFNGSGKLTYSEFFEGCMAGVECCSSKLSL